MSIAPKGAVKGSVHVQPTTAEPAHPTRPTVLVVDDEAQHLQLATYILGRSHEVVTAQSAHEALSLARGRRPDVALVDYRMPGMRGIELLQQLRDIRPDCVRILVTAYSNEDLLKEALNSAAVYRFVSKPVNYEALETDIRRALEHRQARDQAFKAEKLAMAGVLAGIAVHDMRNSVQGLSLIPFWLDSGTPADMAQAKKTLDWSRQIMMDCISEVLAVAKGEVPSYDLTPGHLHDIAEGTVHLYRSLYPKCTFVLDLPADPTYLLRSERHCRRMLSNLVSNAAQATGEGGTVTVSCRTEASGEVHLAVRDDGPGIPLEVQPKLFTPMFSTKGEGGVGLGLRLCQSVMEAHGGNLSFESAPGAGTTFTAHFPPPPR